MISRKNSHIHRHEIIDRAGALKITEAATEIGNIAVYIGANEGGRVRFPGEEGWTMIPEGHVGLLVSGKHADLKHLDRRLAK